MRECIFGVIFPIVLTQLAFAMHRECDGNDIFDVHGFTKNLQRIKVIVAALPLAEDTQEFTMGKY